MSLNPLHTQALDIRQRVAEGGNRGLGDCAHFEMSGCASEWFPASGPIRREVIGKDVILESGDLARAELGPPDYCVEQVFADIQIAQAHVAHQPLVTAARTEVRP